MAHLTKYERETIINFNEGEDTMSVYTHNKALRRRLDQLVQEYPEDFSQYKVTHWGEAAEYYIPKSWIRFHPPRKAAPLTEEQKQKRREHLTKLRDSGSYSGRARQDGELTGSEAGNYIPQDPDSEKGR